MDLFKLVGSIFVDTEEANNSLAKTDEAAEKTGLSFKDTAKKVVTAGTAVVGASTAVVGGMVNLAKNAAATADEIDKGSIRMGISTDYYQQLGYAAGQSGVEMSTPEKAAKKLEGTDLNMEEAMNQIMSLGTASERSQAAAELFGDVVAYQMSPLIEQSGESFDGLIQRANDLGLVMSNDAVTAGVTLGDTMDDLQQSFGAMITQLGSSLMPVVQQLIDTILMMMPMIQEGITLIAPLLSQLFTTLMPPLIELAQMLLPVLTQTILPTLVSLLNAIMPIMGPIVSLLTPLINLVMTLLTPLLDLINLILPPIIELGTALATMLSDTIGKAVQGAIKVFNTLKEAVRNVFNQIKEFVRRPINAVIGFINGLIRGIVGGVNGVIRALNRFHINVPGWITKLTGISQFGFNLSEVSAPQIPLLATGANVEGSGSAIVGEAGAELVELPRGARVTPLGDDDKLSGKLDELIALMRQMTRMGVYIDGAALVGRIGAEMDKELGRISDRAARYA